MNHYSLYFAQAYGETSYGECDYGQTNDACVAAGGSSSGTGASTGGLADTGISMLAIVTVACFVIFAALLVRIWRRPKPLLQEIEPEETPVPPPRTDDQA
jgi:hypothetical protein